MQSKIKPLLFAAAVVGLLVAARAFDVHEQFRRALVWIQDLGPVGPAAFIGIYIAATVLFLPGSVLTLGAGLVFGLGWGFVYVSAASTLGAAAAFLVGRYLARDWIAAKIAGSAKFRAIDAAVGREGWKIVGLTRLSPIFPYNLLNYAYGLTSVSLRDYFFASWLGMMPGTVMYVYIGSLAGDLAALGAAGGGNGAKTVLTLVGFAATAAVTVYITKIARKALNARIEAPS